MAIVSKSNPKGVDSVIEAIQQYLYPNLIGEGWSNYECYPRANKNVKTDSLIPEVSQDPKNYVEVLMNDKFQATSFFLVDDNVTFNNDERLIVQNVSLIFQVVLPELFPSITDHRADEEFHALILQLLTENEELFVDVTGYITGIDNVYSDLRLANYNKPKIDLHDIGKFHVVKFDFTVQWDADDCAVQFSPVCDPVSILLNGVFLQNQLPGTSYNCVTGGGSIDVDINGVPYAPGQSSNIDIPVVDTAANPIGTVDPGVDVEIADVTTTLNGDSITNNKAETSKAINIEYENGNPVTITPVTDTEGVFDGTIPNQKTLVFNRPQSADSVSYADYDAGWRQTNGYIPLITSSEYAQQLDPLDPWKVLHDDSATTGITEHLYRLVGIDGGYVIVDVDDTTKLFFDKDGNPSNESDVFLKDGDNLLIDRLTGMAIAYDNQKQSGSGKTPADNYNEMWLTDSFAGYTGNWFSFSFEEATIFYVFGTYRQGLARIWRDGDWFGMPGSHLLSTGLFTAPTVSIVLFQNNTFAISSWSRTQTTALGRFYVPTRTFEDWPLY